MRVESTNEFECFQLRYNEEKGQFDQPYSDRKVPDKHGFKEIIPIEYDAVIGLFCDWYILTIHGDTQKSKPSFEEVKNDWKTFSLLYGSLIKYKFLFPNRFGTLFKIKETLQTS